MQIDGFFIQLNALNFSNVLKISYIYIRFECGFSRN